MARYPRPCHMPTPTLPLSRWFLFMRIFIPKITSICIRAIPSRWLCVSHCGRGGPCSSPIPQVTVLCEQTPLPLVRVPVNARGLLRRADISHCQMLRCCEFFMILNSITKNIFVHRAPLPIHFPKMAFSLGQIERVGASICLALCRRGPQGVAEPDPSQPWACWWAAGGPHKCCSEAGPSPSPVGVCLPCSDLPSSFESGFLEFELLMGESFCCLFPQKG